MADNVIANMVAKLRLDSSGMKVGAADASEAMGKMTKAIINANIATKALGVAVSAVGKGVKAAADLVKQSSAVYAEYEQLAGGTKLMLGEAYDFVEKRAQDAWKNVQMSQNDYMKQVNSMATGLKTALGGDEMLAAKLADKVVKAEADVVAATGNSREAVENAFNGIMKSNYTMLDNLQLGITPTKEGFQELIDKVNEWNTANGEATAYTIDNLADCQSALVDYIEMQGMADYAAMEGASTMEGASAAMRAAWENAKLALAGGGADIESAFSSLGDALSNWMVQVIPNIAHIFGGLGDALGSAIPAIGEKLSASLPDMVPQLAAGTTKLMIGLGRGLVAGSKILFEVTWEIVKSLGSAFTEIGWPDVGANIINGLLLGLQEGGHNLVAWTEEAIGTLLNKVSGWISEKLGALAELPIIRDLIGGGSFDIDLGGDALLNSAAGQRSQAEIAAQKSADEMAKFRAEFGEYASSYTDLVYSKCNDILDKQEGVDADVRKNTSDIVGAVEGSMPTTGGGGQTALDVVTEFRKAWAETYGSGGAYDLEGLDMLNKALVGVIGPDGIQMDSTDIIDEEKLSGAVQAKLNNITADSPEWIALTEHIATMASSYGPGAVGGMDPASLENLPDLSEPAAALAEMSAATGSLSEAQPIPQETTDSYYTAAAAVGTISGALSGMTEGEEGGAAEGEGSGLLSSFQGIADLMNGEVLTASSNLAAYWSGDFVAAANQLRDALCTTTVDEKTGEVKAGNGNTLYTALGSVKGVMEDIYNTSVEIANHWKSKFGVAVNTMKEHSGAAEGALTTMRDAAAGARDTVKELTDEIWAYIDALDALAGKPGADTDAAKIPVGAGTGTSGSKRNGGRPTGKAVGGWVSAGSEYLVGEEGPELFTPSHNGYIVPNDELGGRSSGTVISVNFNGDVIGDETSIMDMVTRAVKAGIRQEVRSAI